MIRILFVYIQLVLCLAACSQPNDAAQSLPACLEDRATVDTLHDQRGTVAVDGGIVLINLPDSNQVLAPCNLPEGILHGNEIIFSGYIKEIFSNERWAGTPFVLTSVQAADNPS